MVVVKLFLMDLGNTGALTRVVSFPGVGALLSVVGYFAPVPPAPRTPRLRGRVLRTKPLPAPVSGD